MWPKELPDWVKNDSRRGAEIRVFRKLENLLDDKWYVFYSRPWWGINLKGGEVDGEADFILVHAELGLLFLEVKGGGVSYDPEYDQWATIDSHGIRHKIKDPVKQAMTCKHRFLDRLKKVPGWPSRFIKFRHGVILPDSNPPNESTLMIGQYEKFIFCFTNDFDKNLDVWLNQRLVNHAGENQVGAEYGPGDSGVEAMLSLVAFPASLRVPLKREVQGEIETMDILLTGAQMALISIIDSENRALIEGGAGTGKTLLAIELAARCAEQGKRILFTCRSAPLSANVAARLKNFTNVDVLTYGQLELKNKSHLSLTSSLDLNDPYSVVIVDEGQDFEWDWWDLILDMVDKENASLRVFSDSNQAVYRPKDDLATRLNAKSFPLKINLRNTKSIADVTNSLYKGPLIEAPGPHGEWPKTHLTQNLEQSITQALNAVKDLIFEEGFFAEMISVLTPDAETREKVIASLWRMNIPAVDAGRSAISSVVVDTVARFKGLESPAVILISDRTLAKNHELSYVAVSRARSRLIVFGPISGCILEAALLTNSDTQNSYDAGILIASKSVST